VVHALSAWTSIIARRPSLRGNSHSGRADIQIRLAGFTVFAPSLWKAATRPRRDANGVTRPGRPDRIVPSFARYLFVRFSRTDPDRRRHLAGDTRFAGWDRIDAAEIRSEWLIRPVQRAKRTSIVAVPAALPKAPPTIASRIVKAKQPRPRR
jgi:hypothetical protein